MALADGVISKGSSVLDYGCGHGGDIRFLKARKVRARGWDPHFKPDKRSLKPADVVNLGYVLNVIENPAERLETLRTANSLAQRALVVSVRVDKTVKGDEFGDGCLTASNTFQKIYDQTEFKNFVESGLEQRAHVAGLGIVYSFKDEDLEQNYFAARAFSKRLEYRSELIEQFSADAVAKKFVALANKLGRMPLPEEFAKYDLLVEKYGSPERLQRLLLRHVDPEAFQGSQWSRREDILTYLAMLRVQGMKAPQLSALPPSVREDVKAIWKSYSKARDESLRFLYGIGKAELVAEACREAPVGKQLPKSMYVHRSAEDDMPALLRLIVFAARELVGQLEYDLVKIRRDGRAVSFLKYDDFDGNPHPALQYSLRIYLPRSEYDIREYHGTPNPPILHRKETFVSASYPRYELFKRLTEKEEAKGLLSSTQIGYRNQWNEMLALQGLEIRGHSLRNTPKTGSGIAGAERATTT